MKKHDKEKNIVMEKRNVALFLFLFFFLQTYSSQAQDTPVINTEVQNIILSSEQIFLATEYLAANPVEASEIARTINFLPQSEWEDPSNMCGPLAGIILYRANIWSPDVIGEETFQAHDFWKLDPHDLPNIFPPTHFDQLNINTSVWDIDFSVFPLQLGDFVYLEGGSFDHMLVITKIERTSNGYRAYSVTNIHTDGGFVIQEILLFDTSDTEAGYFENQFSQTNSWTGQTGARKIHVYRRTQASV